jgi:tetratricopeptide (TPR) repeat protein
LKDQIKQGVASGWLANSYSLSGQPQRAIRLLEQQITIFEKINHKGYLTASLDAITKAAYMPTGYLNNARANIKRMIKLCYEIGDGHTAAGGYQDLGRLLAYSGNWKESDENFQTALKIHRAKAHIQGQCLTFIYWTQSVLLMTRNIARSKIKTKKSAIKLAQHALALAEEKARDEPVECDFIRAHWLLGAAYCSNHQFVLAEQHVSEALLRDRAINMVDHEANILLDLARLRYSQANYEEAKSLANEALTIAERCGYVLQGADVNLFLAQYALEQEKNKVKAKEYAEIALKLAYCDGPPYYYKVAYKEAERMLEKLK